MSQSWGSRVTMKLRHETLQSRLFTRMQWQVTTAAQALAVQESDKKDEVDHLEAFLVQENSREFRLQERVKDLES
ncbi:hypothetical protein LIER_09157 [Lithospermum erythrorhizon]|uniref:Uncharacterized protein n=1 Tax=Lithospermum erythrorhizon TaxID=34254 RepID=A0AAV3PEP6_LITER